LPQKGAKDTKKPILRILWMSHQKDNSQIPVFAHFVPFCG
jgi:hypothetical protein